jgi:signal transduction histidine kinase
MTAIISHELRTPLNLVIGFSQMLVTSPETYGLQNLPLKAHHDLENVCRSAQQLVALVEDVLDMASADQGHLPLLREPGDPWAVIEESAALIRDCIEAKNLQLRLVKETEILLVLMDRLRIRQVMLNLLINAARFTSEGSITVRGTAQDAGVEVENCDTGRGISPEQDCCASSSPSRGPLWPHAPSFASATSGTTFCTHCSTCAIAGCTRYSWG